MHHASHSYPSFFDCPSMAKIIIPTSCHLAAGQAGFPFTKWPTIRILFAGVLLHSGHAFDFSRVHNLLFSILISNFSASLQAIHRTSQHSLCEIMELFIHSKPISPEAAQKIGCFTTLPIRIHKRDDIADVARIP